MNAAVGLATVSLVVWILLHRTLGRRWAGELVLDASSPSRQQRVGFACTLLSVALSAVAVSLRSIHVWFEIFAATLLLCGASVWPLVGKLEIRTHGILSEGRLIPWDQIESCDWEFHRRLKPNSVILKIERRRFLKILPPVGIVVSRSKIEEITRVLNGYLSEWPS